MNHAAVRWMSAAVTSLAGVAVTLADPGQFSITLPGGQSMHVEFQAPDGADDHAARPVAIIFAGGPQTPELARGAVALLQPWARTHGWVVVSPAAVDRQIFVTGAEKHLPALFAELRKRFTVEGGQFHFLGVSNGGLSAFRAATQHPTLVRSVVTFPGHPRTPDDTAMLKRLKGVPIRMFVGANDQASWVNAARDAEAAGRAAGLDIRLDIREGEGHMIRNLSDKDLIDMLNSFRPPAPSAMDPATAAERARIAAVLDQFHAAAAKADEAAYFALFAPEGVFIGTDASERWTVAQFREYAKPFFSKGKGWTYTPGVRNIDLSPDQSIAWFDEALDNVKYGRCRGTGVLRRIDGQWKIAQYHLTVPVPNGLLERVVKMIQTEEKKK